MKTLHFVVRVIRVILHLITALWTCAAIFPFTDNAGRAWRIRHWSGQLLAMCRLTVHVDRRAADDVGKPALAVCNHVSWLDIFVINSMQPTHFVAKSDIRDWPLIGWLCATAGTVFIARGRMRDVRRIFENLVASLRTGDHVAFFPEGTTASQGQILPFHANLFEAAIDAGVPIQPYALRYLDRQGRLHPSVDFVGDMSFAESMLAILRGDKIVAQLIVLPPLDSNGAHRRELAQAAHNAISAALGYSAK
ncbi:MAG TPA: lysophospholipid acyltransferase family protein [Burkholderiaceae bacterium]